MINIDKNNIKNTPEYESFGGNEFPLKYLTEEELMELGLKKSCCSRGGCSKKENGGCPKNSKDGCGSCSQKLGGCCKKR
ncbi:hypothetical protein [Clostridium sp.]|uniref:hypothetical protein n=1 Tax=Clostridium sp. TaxID=1506 RepID=UPI002622E531|nr:hypothetical protein [Clostridium sp.]